MSNRKSVGYSKKYAQAMRSFDRSVTRTTNAVSRVAFGQTKRGQTRQDLSAASGNWERTSLTNKQLIASCVVGAILPTVCLVGKDATTETTGMLLLVLFFFFAIQRSCAPENGMHCKSKLHNRRKCKRSE